VLKLQAIHSNQFIVSFANQYQHMLADFQAGIDTIKERTMLHVSHG
jgi:hypothetical protein